jgi:hypothetical protein
VKITQQNALNAKSTSGVYLLPGQYPCPAEQPDWHAAHVAGQHGGQCDGTRLTLRIQGESNDPLPAFSGTVEWGQIQGTTESYQEVNVKNQLFTARPASGAERC